MPWPFAEALLGRISPIWLSCSIARSGRRILPNPELALGELQQEQHSSVHLCETIFERIANLFGSASSHCKRFTISGDQVSRRGDLLRFRYRERRIRNLLILFRAFARVHRRTHMAAEAVKSACISRWCGQQANLQSKAGSGHHNADAFSHQP